MVRVIIKLSAKKGLSLEDDVGNDGRDDDESGTACEDIQGGLCIHFLLGSEFIPHLLGYSSEDSRTPVPWEVLLDFRHIDKEEGRHWYLIRRDIRDDLLTFK